jgi:RNA polymerase sigma factor (TIGR02999 family)
LFKVECCSWTCKQTEATHPADGDIRPLVESLDMVSETSAEITALIRAWRAGDQTARDRVTPLVYNELRRIAAPCMRKQRAGHTLQTTALVHEAYVRLVDARSAGWENRAHFFAMAATVMRRILIDAARARASQKRGGAVQQVNHSSPINLDELPASDSGRSTELLALDHAMTRLEQMDGRKARVVELRFYGGLSVEETAEVLQVSQQTVMRDWRLARVWLARELRA